MRSTRGACEAAKYVEIDSEADEAEAVEFAAPIKRVIVKKSTNAFKSKNAEQTVKRGTPDRTDLVNDDDDDDDDDLFDSEEEQEAVKKNKLTTGARAAARKSATAARDIKANVRLPERHLKREKNNVSIEIKSTRAKKADKVREFKDADRKSIRQRVGNDVLYAEVDSEEEFVKENIDFLHSDDDDLSKASGYSHSGSSKSDDAVVYRIEAILATRSLTAMNWRAVCGYMSTREVTRGSVWLQPEEEYASMTEDLVTKYLIKWEHASYLHVSWETEKDLEDMSESNVKAILKRFSKKYVDPFSLVETREKLVPNSYDLLPVSYLTVERILDVEDESIDISTMPHATAILPYEDTLTMDTDDESVFLHGTECFVVVKWEGIGYSDLSFESVHDLRGANIPYEAQLRQFYRREQRCLDLKRGKLTGRVDVSLLQMEAPPLFPGGRTLRDYQWDGVKWLLFNWTQKRNSILADEMGLGKTIQTACFLEILTTTFQQRGPFLIVVPLSTMVNWQRELTRWTSLDVVVYYGSVDDRENAREHEFYYDVKNKKAGYKLEVVITTPETLTGNDSRNSSRIVRELAKIAWDVVVVDEAHKIKNHDSKFTSVLRDEFTFKACALLTGTPLQNAMEELWTLLNFIDRKEFNDRDDFIGKYGDLKLASQLESLHAKLRPYLLRREKEHVEKTVPPKTEILVEVELTNIQKQYYRAIYEMKTSFLYNGEAKDGPRLTSLAMELRKCCLHLFLIKGAEPELFNHFKDESAVNVIIKASAKMTLLDKLLPKLKSEGHRVLIFSQFKIMLDIIEDYLDLKHYRYERVDGSIVGKKRQESIDKFTVEDDIFVMLLSTRAGGVGINLTQADTVIIFDSDWNPQNDLQAIARAHRIGQMKEVKVYRFLTKDTYEQAMFRAASVKLGLDYAVMHNMSGRMEGISADRSAAHVSELSRKELENLLKHGAYGAFSEDKVEVDMTEEETIEQILSRSATILHDNEGKQDEGDATVSFSKASFVSAVSDATNAVSVDDPDFWHKVVGLAVREEEDGRVTKRKCRDFVGSYKEPSMHIKGSLLSARADNDESGSDAEDGKAKKRKVTEVTADWTEANLAKLMTALVGRGYLNWEDIKRDARLKWNLADIALGCRICVVSLLCSAMQADPSLQFSALVKKYRILQFVLAACGGSFCSPIGEPSYQSTADTIPPEMEVVESCVTVSKIDNSSETSMSKSFLSIHILSSIEESISSVQMRGVRVEEGAVREMNPPFALVEKDAGTKLTQLESLLDVRLLTLLFPLPNLVVGAATADDEMIEHAEKTPDAVPIVGVIDPLEPVLDRLYATGELIAPASWWTAHTDARLLRAIVSSGLPDNKKRLTSIVTTMGLTENCATAVQDPKTLMMHLGILLSILRGGDIKKQVKALPYAAAVLRTISRIGRPHKLHEILQENGADQKYFLLSWEQFIRECGSFPTLDIPRLKQFVQELLNVSTIPAGGDNPIERGLLSGLTPKNIDEALSKADIMYQIRTLLSSSVDLYRELSKAMQTGPSVPPYARDKSMPVWWTQAHDVKLLKLVTVYGLGQWKKVLSVEAQALPGLGTASADELSIVDMPASFTMPLRENGAEWLLTVTSKSMEKRLMHLLKSADPYAAFIHLPQSPRRTLAISKAISKNVSTIVRTIPRQVSSFNWGAVNKPSDLSQSINLGISKPSELLASTPATKISLTLGPAISQPNLSPLGPIIATDTPLSTQARAVSIAETIGAGNEGMDSPVVIISRFAERLLVQGIDTGTDCESMEIEATSAQDQDIAAIVKFGIQAENARDVKPSEIEGVGGCQTKETTTQTNVKTDVSQPLATDIKKRKATDISKISVKKSAPQSASILLFFTKKPTLVVEVDESKPAEPPITSILVVGENPSS